MSGSDGRYKPVVSGPIALNAASKAVSAKVPGRSMGRSIRLSGVMAATSAAISLRTAAHCPPKRDARHKAGHDRLIISIAAETLASVETVAMKIGAMSVEPSLGMAHMRADTLDQPPEPARVVHLDQMSNLVGSE